MEQIKKLTPIEKHSARVFAMAIFMLLFWGFIGIISELLFQLLFGKSLNIAGTSGVGLFIGMYFMWKTNIRFGWVENLIGDKKKHPHLSAWFAKVHN